MNIAWWECQANTEWGRQQGNGCGENLTGMLWCCLSFPTADQLEQPTSFTSTVLSEHLQTVRDAECHWLLGQCRLWKKRRQMKMREWCSGSGGTRLLFAVASALARDNSTESVTSDAWGEAVVSTVGEPVPFPSSLIRLSSLWEFPVLWSVSCFFDVPDCVWIRDTPCFNDLSPVAHVCWVHSLL